MALAGYVRSGAHTTNAAAQRMRRLRESYVPQRVTVWMREEGQLKLRFDLAKTTEEKLKILDGLLKLRRMIMEALGWPKPPTLRGGKLPQAMEGERNHELLADIDVAAIPVPAPSEGSNET